MHAWLVQVILQIDTMARYRIVSALLASAALVSIRQAGTPIAKIFGCRKNRAAITYI